MNNSNTPTIRWQLFSTVSALALLGSACTAVAAGNDVERPLLWLELGGQAENIRGQGEVFAPAFLAANSTSPVLQSVTPLQAQRPPRFALGEQGKISFAPESSDWIFSAAIRYGRSGSSREVDHQTDRVNKNYYNGAVIATTTAANFADTQAYRRESHAILDFSAAKDIGLGLFGRDGDSALGFGIRFAQFMSDAKFDIRARPDLAAKYISAGSLRAALPYFHTYHATGHAARSFRGVGPSLSWNGSMPFAGNRQQGEVTFDWAVDASLLFGRQKARVQHQESAHYVSKFSKYYHSVYPAIPRGHDATRSIAVPNAGGFASMSFRVENFKVSLGYRADFFFGAMDGGIDSRKSETLAFKGPFASVSVGLGD
jgi:iron complex outermembrane recepter protein